MIAAPHNRESALADAMRRQPQPGHFREDYAPLRSAFRQPAVKRTPRAKHVPPISRPMAHAASAETTIEKQWPRAYPANLPYGQHPGDRICPRGQQQLWCDCETCTYWASRYSPGDG